MQKFNVGLFNDSFPPTIDGVANATVNYARVIQNGLGNATVVTPYYPEVTDDYPFEVVRYPSAFINGMYDYRVGNPFSVKTVNELCDKNLQILHSHCPIISTVLTRVVRKRTHAPIIYTHHAKFDIEIEKLTASDALRRVSLKLLISNISACDEIWVVSEGAGENLRSMGYKGDYIVMRNGTDFNLRRSSEAQLDELRKKHGIEKDTPVFLFVGRMMWYKGTRLSLDGLKIAKESGEKFKYVLIGDGTEKKDIENYAKKLGLEDDCLFTGAIRDREVLRTYFCLADLFLFPSDFDTNGIVVSEAAACSCPSLLLEGSCAAEGVVDGRTGLIIGRTAAEMAEKIKIACHNREAMRKIGENASREIYLSWDDSIHMAYERYNVVYEKYKYDDKKAKSMTPLIDTPINQLIQNYNSGREYLGGMVNGAQDWMSDLADEARAEMRKKYDETKEKVGEKLEHTDKK
ncbi:MAG: glycosyltransferase [Oscillospiraceae bacterium]